MRHLSNAAEAVQWLRQRVTGTLQTDSRLVVPGDGFIAWPGAATDGRAHIASATARGATACLVEQVGMEAFGLSGAPTAELQDLKAATGEIAAQWFGQPSHALQVVAFTGTNGKTSSAWWLVDALQKCELLAHAPCGLVGTLGMGLLPHLENTGMTTPDPVRLQRAFRHMVDAGVRTCAIEASSIGLAEHRLAGTRIRVAVFTNFTQDHLDYHGSMEAYGEIKSRLFYWQGLQHAVINADDGYGAELAGRLKTERPGLVVYCYGFAEDADIRITGFSATSGGMTVTLDTPWGAGECQTRLLGRFNAQNLAACVGVLCATGYPLQPVLNALARIRPATGRMDCIMNTGKPLVVVDYAHTPDALEKALATLQEIKPQGASLWCVFGCGGNRDKGKRPLMGAAAVAGADKVVVTSDNPRMEEPQAIIDDILPAVPNPEHIEADRLKAENRLPVSNYRDFIHK